MMIQKVVFEGGKGKETGTRDHMNTVRRAAQADEWRTHLPFCRRIEEGKLIAGSKITCSKNQHACRIQKGARVAGMIHGGQLSHLHMLIDSHLNRELVGVIVKRFGGNLTDDFPFSIWLRRCEASEFVLSSNYQ